METRMLPSRSALLLPILFLLASKPAAPQTFAALCNGPGLLCVSSALVRSQLSNPLDFTVIINSTEDIAVTWEVTDSTGLVLESNSADNFLLPLKSVTPQRKTLHIKDYFIKPAKSDIGMLTLTPTRRDSSGGKTDLPPLKIPVRLPTATTQLTFFLPNDGEAFRSEVSRYVDNQNQKDFSPKTPLAPHTVIVMQTNPDQLIGATAEAAARGYVGQGPWHLIDSRLDGDTAHLTLSGDGWAGVTYYLAGLKFLITKSVLNIPGIKHVEFDQPPSP
jgi:hypothetical protein